MRLPLSALLLVFSTIATAVPITFTDVLDPNPDVSLFQNGPSYNFIHDINDDGYDINTDSIQSVLLTIDAIDDGDYDYDRTTSYSYTTWCGRHSRYDSYHCHYATGYRTTPGQLENLGVDADGTVFGDYEVDYNPIGYNVDVADLLDGLLDVTLDAGLGDLIFRSSTLEVLVDRTSPLVDQSTSVSSPATLSLLGLGLIMCGHSRRQKIRK